MVSITYHADLDEVQGEPCVPAPCGGAPFERIGWWRGLADDCGLKPLVAVARAGDAVALLALAQTPRRLEALANWYNFRWRPLGDAALFAPLTADLAQRAARITLEPMLADDAAPLAAAFAEAGWVVERVPCGINHLLPVAGRDFATYLAKRPGPLRTTLARRGPKLTVKIFDHFEPSAFAAYEAIYAASWKPAEGSPAFIRHFAEAEGAAGRLRLGLARAGGEAVAAQLWTVEAGTAFIHKLAHLPTAKALSPGTVLTAALLELVIDRDGVTLVDFGTGDEPYKRDWMETSRPLIRLDLFNPARPGQWPHILRARLRRLAGAGTRG